MNPALQRIRDLINQARPSVMTLGVVKASDPASHTLTVRYMDGHGQWRVAEGVPSAMDPGIWSSGFRVDDVVQIVFQGGNPQAPVVVRRIETRFDERRHREWQDPMPWVFPESMDEGGAEP